MTVLPDRRDGRTRLRQYVAEETETLLKALDYYVLVAGLATGDQVRIEAIELLNEVVVEALTHAERFDPNGYPKAWLQGIAANLIKRKQVKQARLNRREPLIRDIYQDDQDLISDDELFDQVATLVDSSTDPAQILESNEAIAAFLEGLPTSEQQVLHLAIVTGLDGNALANELGISPGAARVRLHRALNKLRHIVLEGRS